MAEDLKKMYRTIMDDHFPPKMEISFIDESNRQTLYYEKVTWTIDNVQKGLRYGENPGQEAALYRMVNGNLVLGQTQTIQPGRYLASDIELLQSGKHPGKTNLTDADNSLNILRYFNDKPGAVIVKHNNPCGVALAGSLEDAYLMRLSADNGKVNSISYHPLFTDIPFQSWGMDQKAAKAYIKATYGITMNTDDSYDGKKLKISLKGLMISFRLV